MSYVVEDLSKGSGLISYEVAGETLLKGKLVYLDSGGNWLYADASAEASMPAVGLTLEAIPAGVRGKILFIGKFQYSGWSFTPGSLLFASTSEGEISMTAPNQSGEQVQAVGKALSQTLILFNPSYVLVEVA